MDKFGVDSEMDVLVEDSEVDDAVDTFGEDGEMDDMEKPEGVQNNYCANYIIFTLYI